MRITNKIMQNNSLFNINNNKVLENNTALSIMTGKKYNRPSDNPTVAIRALRLRASVSELDQYYEKNVKDASSWLSVTESALTSISGTDSILIDLQKLITASPNKYKTLSDFDALITQMEQLSNEYYNVGNTDYAGRYIFTGFRTDTPLSFLEDTSKEYKDINDEFNAEDLSISNRITNISSLADGDESTNPKVESDILQYSISRLRLSYNNLDMKNNDFKLQYRENMTVPAVSTVLPEKANVDAVNLSFTTKDGTSHTVHLPVNDGSLLNGSGNEVKTVFENADGSSETYKAVFIPQSANSPARYEIEYNINNTFTGKLYLNEKGVLYDADPNISARFPSEFNKDILTATSSVNKINIAEVKITPTINSQQEILFVPLSASAKQPYNINLEQNGKNYVLTVNTDGTYSIESACLNSDNLEARSIVNLNANGAIYSSYVETSLLPESTFDSTIHDSEIDNIYKKLNDTYNNNEVFPDYSFVVNSATGEVLLSKGLSDKLTNLKNINNANTINTVFNKTNFKKGDTRPEHLFRCITDKIKYNYGSAGHTMSYDVGFNQKIEVNTETSSVFSNDIKRSIEDLRNILNKAQDIDNKINILQTKLNNSSINKEQINKEISAAKKAYDYTIENLIDDFGTKITTITKVINKVNNATTINGTRSKRLELIESRLMEQTSIFKELQSENEDVDLAEAATLLAMSRLSYEASLNATGKIMTTSLMNYI